ncbi:helix-turn-helix domain-containing protein [Streptomyces sp. NPDC087512]|uniref:helix-turn-helix domain-containing protein n=1 Tax=Streptomyces sp. NPDC087512 TaxID=3155059 RepID=UPI0034310245
MVNLAELLTAPGLEAVRPLTGPLDAAPVTGVRLVPRPDLLASVPPGTVAVLLAPVPRHLLDVVVRDAAAAGAAAVVLTGPEWAAHIGTGAAPDTARGSGAPDIAWGPTAAVPDTASSPMGAAPGGVPGPAPAPATASATVASVPATVRSLAERGRVAVLHTGGDLAALVVAVERAAAGGTEDELARVQVAASEIPAAAGDPERIAVLAGRILGVPVEQRAAGPGEEGASAVGAQGEVRYASAVPPGRAGAVRPVLALAALAAAGGAPADVPARSRGPLLAELLTAPRDQVARLAARGRALGLPVDGWHIALRLAPVALDGTVRYGTLEAVTAEAQRLLRSWPGTEGTGARHLSVDSRTPPAATTPDGPGPAADTTSPAGQSPAARTASAPTSGAPATTAGSGPRASWNAALVDEALVLLCSLPADPGADGRRALVATARRAVDRLRGLHPKADFRCGVGAAHRGPLGIRGSAREARAALARAADAPVAAHDAAGLDRMLLEWYGSEAAREAVGEMLAPVLALGPDRAEPLLRTVQAYLDHNNSPARAAEVLHLHRNAVGARVRRFVELTGADLADPEQRIALQLACRAGLSAPSP